jgi:hypothetical protein
MAHPEPPRHLHITAPGSISSAAASRACSRRARSATSSPPPPGYLMTLAYTTRPAVRRTCNPTVKDC